MHVHRTGQWLLLYFGFTNCAEICPKELHKLEYALGQHESDHPCSPSVLTRGVVPCVREDLLHMDRPDFPIVPLFISVDPKRDTPERMRQYAKVGLRARGIRRLPDRTVCPTGLQPAFPLGARQRHTTA